MRFERLTTRSAAWRGALWITLIALFASSVALTLQYVQTTRTLSARREAVLDDEAIGLIERYRAGGPVDVVQAIRQQLAVPRIHEFFYLFAMPDGTPLAGNLTQWPAGIDEPGFYSFETAVTNTRGDSSQRWVETRVVVTDGGLKLLVGDFADERATLRQRYVAALLWTLLATGIVGLLFGWWYSRRGLAFVEQVSSAGRRFLDGAMNERVPITARGDEYDRLAATINRTFEEVERLVGSLRTATDGMAHDLKTPLTRIRARLELAEMREVGEPQLRYAIAETRSDLDGMLRLIEDMLSLARAETTAGDSFQPISIDAIVSEALELYQPLAEEKGLVLDAQLSSAVVRGSRSLIGRLIANLLDNAIKFTPSGGHVAVLLRADADAILLSVADDGPGIPAVRREDVLGRFRRLDESRSTPGNGLGLSIVEAVARVHGANLVMEDNKPGLRIEVKLPIYGKDRVQVGSQEGLG